jgi:hypothetical protein
LPVIVEVRATASCVLAASTITRSGWKPTLIALPATPSPM